jgi:tRNA-dihydrouridine synthase 3
MHRLTFRFLQGEGCALMGRPARLEHIVRSIKSVTDLPLTVKMRTGLQEDHNIAHTVLPKLAKWNVAMTTVS